MTRGCRRVRSHSCCRAPSGPGSTMTGLLLPPLLMLLAALIPGSRASGTPSFRCYQCRVANNEDCHDGYLKTCPTDQAYDVCMTMVVKNAQQGFFIEKKCALGPCNLRDEKQSQGLGLDTCDRSKDSYSCFECCKGDGCNTNAARRRSPLLSMPPLLLLTAVLAGRRA
ncbi:uncharacterized protein LOC119379215 [Rhipicephalus sanguineus]|uniref:uncharacterized protein LOC119379215 n=1 Tax=Rhipicephalus sanguineus TaxID=34632 RepID=UPI0020C39C54|nr:uncharacterized protein LOC119379215 [Rhipicephalus sanguineus]